MGFPNKIRTGFEHSERSKAGTVWQKYGELLPDQREVEVSTGLRFGVLARS